MLNDEKWRLELGLVYLTRGEREVEEKAPAKNKHGSLGEQRGLKNVCDNACTYKDISGLSVFFRAIKLLQKGDLW